MFITPNFFLSAGENKCNPTSGTFKTFQKQPFSKTIPDTTLLTGSARKISLKEYFGKGLVINFWATWCAPCVAEMPQLDILASLVKANNVEVLTISEDRNGLSKVRFFLKKNKLYNLPILLDDRGSFLKALGINGIPATILVTKDGMEVGRVIGKEEWDSANIVKFIRDCLGKK